MLIRCPPSSTRFPYTTLFRSPQTWERISPEDQKIIEDMMGEQMAIKASQIYDADGQAGWVKAEEEGDRKSTRLNSSHVAISYAVFCLKKKIRDVAQVGELPTN